MPDIDWDEIARHAWSKNDEAESRLAEIVAGLNAALEQGAAQMPAQAHELRWLQTSPDVHQEPPRDDGSKGIRAGSRMAVAELLWKASWSKDYFAFLRRGRPRRS